MRRLCLRSSVSGVTIQPSPTGTGSVDGTARYDPLASLACHRRYEIEVSVAVKHREVLGLSGCCDQQVGNRPPSQPALSEQALRLACPAQVVGRRLDQLQCADAAS